MEKIPTCPDKKLLQEFVRQSLSGDKATWISDHVSECTSCNSYVSSLQTDDGDNSVDSGRDLQTVSFKNLDFFSSLKHAEELAESDFDFKLLTPVENANALGRFGKYEVQGLLGRGGMGLVFRAVDEQLRRPVAIKFLRGSISSSPTARRRFIREARAAAAINHPNVVTIHSVDEERNQPFIVMEFVSGGSLRDRLANMRILEPLDAIRVSSQIAQGLAAAHARGVIHRDIKPGNIMVEGELDRVKITDFGLARATVDNEELTSRLTTVGTPAYMSPEQVAGEEVDARTDLFSLGCVMYAMLAGRAPFQGKTTLDTAQRLAQCEPNLLGKINDKTPPFYAEIVRRLLDRDPSRRIQTAAEVADILNRQLTVLNQTRTDKIDRVMHELTAPQQPARTARRALILAGIMAVILLGVSGAWWKWNTALRSIFVSAEPGGQNTDLAPLAGSHNTSNVLTVAKSGDAEFQTINAALRRVLPGGTIRVLDRATYDEVVHLDNHELFRDVRIEATNRAEWKASSGETLLRISNVPGVVISGFHLPLQKDQHGIGVSGDVRGTTLEDLSLEQPPESALSAIVVEHGAAGTSEKPLVFRRLRIVDGWMGLVIFGTFENPIRHVRVEDCRFTGTSAQSSTHVIMENAIEDVTLTNNIFHHAKIGLSISIPEPNRLRNFAIVSNTFFDLEGWLNFNSTSPEQASVEIARNAVAQCFAMHNAPQQTSPLAQAFHDNLWELTDFTRISHEQATMVAQIVEQLPFISREPADDTFLRPTLDKPFTLSHLSTDPSSVRFVGALKPQMP